jgi:hypothetical protein
MASNFMTGNRAEFYYGGQPVAHATDWSVDRSFDQVEIIECGSDTTQAIVLVGQRVRLNTGFYRVIDEDLYSKGVMPSGVEGSLTEWKEMTVVLYDRATGKPLWEIQGCMPASESNNGSARSACQMSTSWTGRIYRPTSEL